MSFFDEADEPPRKEPRTRPRATVRTRPSRRGSSDGSGRRPPGDQQTVQVRRAVAIGALLVVIVLIALGVHSCQVSANNSALQSYTSQASSLIQQSNANGAALFRTLSGASAMGASGAQNAVNSVLNTATTIHADAERQSVPGAMQTANGNLLFALRMRDDGISAIAAQIQPAIAGSTSALNQIALEVARLYASDVTYKDYAAHEIASQMNAAGLRFNALPSGQFVPSLSWLLPSYIATQLHVTIKGATTTSPCTTQPCGTGLNSVSVNGTQFSTGSANSVSSSTPTFALNFTNLGKTTETDVVCKVHVNGTSITATATVARAVVGKTYTCNVPLGSAAPAGNQTVVATIEKVPGETNLTDNSATYTVTFP